MNIEIGHSVVMVFLLLAYDLDRRPISAAPMETFKPEFILFPLLLLSMIPKNYCVVSGE